MKKYFYFAAAALALASCASDDFVGENPEGGETGKAISLNSISKVQTRAGKTGAEAAELLNNNFVLYGNKKSSSDAIQKVFDNYQANYVVNTANSTESNSAGWEYVGYQTKQTSATEQTIKYWDFSAKEYGYFAYSLGKGVTSGSTTTYATVSEAMSATSTDLNSGTYKLKGSAAELAACYITDKFQILKENFGTDKTEVEFSFQSFGAKARVAFYETIPGYSVKDVKFYPSATGTQSTTATLFDAGTTASLPAGGEYSIKFDDEGKAQVTLENTTGYTNESKVEFGTMTYDATNNPTLVGKEYQEEEGNVYLGRSSNAATYAGTTPYYTTVLPNPNGTVLTLKVDYTLVSRDGSGETIDVKGATATVPAAYTQWKPNYAYTYIFKISDNTNGQIGDVTGLYPITLDAIVTEDVDGNQETITSVADPSITTYQKGVVVTANDEYTAGDIYVVVGEGTALTADNAKLYTATIEDDAAQGITEESVANCLKNYTGVTTSSSLTAVTGLTAGTSDVSSYYTKVGDVYYKCSTGAKAATSVDYYDLNSATITGYVVKDAKGKTLTVSTSDKLTTGVTKITDTVDGKEITVDCGKIEAAAATIYVFEYIKDGKKTYKVIKVKA